MAEAVAALYAVETAVEGAAVGAYAASRPTVPLHCRFRKLKLPGMSGSEKGPKTSIGHTLNVIKDKAYVIGGDVVGSEPDAAVRLVRLPTSQESNDVDFQIVEPVASRERPLQPYSTADMLATEGKLPGYTQVDEKDRSVDKGDAVFEARSEHSSAAIDTNIYIFAGRPAHRLDGVSATEKAPSQKLFSCETIRCFSTQTNTWSTLDTVASHCKDGVPAPRTRATCAAIPHPEPGNGIEVTTSAYGTLIMHGGYSTQGDLLRDVWSFDVGSRVWTRWPDVPESTGEEVAGEGRILVRGETIYRVGDGFGKVMFIDIDITRGDAVNTTSGPHYAEIAVKAKTSTWQVRSFGTDPAKESVGTSASLPLPRRGAGFAGITTGAGRFYDLYFMGQPGPGTALQDIWTLQVKSEKNTAAALKDGLRRMVGKSSGEHEWALAEVVEHTKKEGPLDRPQGLYDVACDAWTDEGGANVIIWGGRDAEGTVQSDGWILSGE